MNMKTSFLFAGVATAALGGAAAIGLAAQTGTAADSYRLVQVGGNALPALLEQDSECREEVLDATLTLDAGTWVLVTTERETCGSQVEEEEEREEGTYVVDGATLRFSDDETDDHQDAEDRDDDSASDIDLEDLASGSLSGNALSITLEDGRTVVRFDR